MENMTISVSRPPEEEATARVQAHAAAQLTGAAQQEDRISAVDWRCPARRRKEHHQQNEGEKVQGAPVTAGTPEGFYRAWGGPPEDRWLRSLHWPRQGKGYLV